MFLDELSELLDLDNTKVFFDSVSPAQKRIEENTNSAVSFIDFEILSSLSKCNFLLIGNNYIRFNSKRINFLIYKRIPNNFHVDKD